MAKQRIVTPRMGFKSPITPLASIPVKRVRIRVTKTRTQFMERKKRTALDKETNPTVYNRLQRYQLSCSICPPNKAENAHRHAKRGDQKPKRKNINRATIRKF